MADEIIRHVNCASDFRIVFAFSGGKLPDYPWRLGLKTPNTPSYNMYVASFDGTTYNNCSPLDDESIMVFVDHHRLVPGILHYYLQTDAPDSLFPDGEMNITIPGTVNIELWDGPSDGDTPPEVTVITERLLKGEKGDTPVLTANPDGTILSDGVVLTDVLKVAAKNSDTQTARVEKLADNPPKIVEVDGMAYWAFYDLETKQYVVSENRADVGDAVLFSPQGLNAEQRAQVQTNIGVKSAVDVIGAGEAQAIPMDVAKDGKYRFYTGGIYSSSSYFISKPFSVKRGDVIVGKLTAIENVSILSQVDSDNNFIKLLLRGEGINMSVHYAVTQDMQISFSANKTGFSLALIPCELVKSLAEPVGGYSRRLYESYGAVYNEETGFYELNGFTDITEEEMWNIYRYLNFNDMAMFVGKYPYDGINLKVRTNIPFQYTIQNSGSNSAFRITHKWSYLCTGLKYVEKIVISRIAEEVYLCADNFIGCSYLFYDCSALVEIDGIIDFSKRDGVLAYVLTNCPKLKSFKLLGLHNDATFRESPSINLDTFRYIIENSTNTGAITITVDPTIYGYLTGTTQPAPETGGTAEEWQALVTTAQEKQISFASA